MTTSTHSPNGSHGAPVSPDSPVELRPVTPSAIDQLQHAGKLAMDALARDIGEVALRKEETLARKSGVVQKNDTNEQALTALESRAEHLKARQEGLQAVLAHLQRDGEGGLRENLEAMQAAQAEKLTTLRLEFDGKDGKGGLLAELKLVRESVNETKAALGQTSDSEEESRLTAELSAANRRVRELERKCESLGREIAQTDASVKSFFGMLEMKGLETGGLEIFLAETATELGDVHLQIGELRAECERGAEALAALETELAKTVEHLEKLESKYVGLEKQRTVLERVAELMVQANTARSEIETDLPRVAQLREEHAPMWVEIASRAMALKARIEEALEGAEVEFDAHVAKTGNIAENLSLELKKLDAFVEAIQGDLQKMAQADNPEQAAACVRELEHSVMLFEIFLRSLGASRPDIVALQEEGVEVRADAMDILAQLDSGDDEIGPSEPTAPGPGDITVRRETPAVDVDDLGAALAGQDVSGKYSPDGKMADVFSGIAGLQKDRATLQRICQAVGASSPEQALALLMAREGTLLTRQRETPRVAPIPIRHAQQSSRRPGVWSRLFGGGRPPQPKLRTKK